MKKEECTKICEDLKSMSETLNLEFDDFEQLAQECDQTAVKLLLSQLADLIGMKMTNAVESCKKLELELAKAKEKNDRWEKFGPIQDDGIQVNTLRKLEHDVAELKEQMGKMKG